MLELLDSLTSDNLVLICLILGVLALCLAIGISIEMYTVNKKYEKIKAKEKESVDNTQSRLNIKESADIKYVDENSELEKTKAKMELEKLREKLRLEEEEKQRAIEANINIEREKQAQVEQQVENNNEDLEKTIVNLKPIVVEQKQVPTETQIEELDDTKEIDLKSIEEAIPSDEEDAIISYEELKNAKNFGYTDEEMYNNADEQDAIISMQELEKLYHESQNINVTLEDKKEINNIESNTVNVEKENFKNSPNISPVYGYAKTDQDLVLEQTQNLEKLNEEIRKTNEFLKMLKDLKKNLD